MRSSALTLSSLPLLTLLGTLCIYSGEFGTPSSARAQAEQTAGAESHVREGQRLYTELDFLGAVGSFTRALAVPDISAQLRLEALEYLGASYVVLEQEDRAATAYTELFELDPYHATSEPSGSPKIAEFAESIRREVAPDAALDPAARLQLVIPESALAGDAIPVRLTLRAEGEHSVQVGFRGAGETTYTLVETARIDSGRFKADLPEQENAGPLEIYGEARNLSGQLVTRSASPLSPLRVDILPGSQSASGAITSQWWFWTAIGVALVATATILVVAVSASSAPDGSLDTIQLP